MINHKEQGWLRMEKINKAYKRQYFCHFECCDVIGHVTSTDRNLIFALKVY